MLTRPDWSGIRWELKIDDRPIDLQRFGAYEFALPAMSHDASPIGETFAKFTAWEVVLSDLNPVQHKIRGSAQM